MDTGKAPAEIERKHIDALMEASGVKFGTSGARGLVSAMTDEVCYALTIAFLHRVAEKFPWATQGEVGIAGDLRASTERIMQAVTRACLDAGWKAVPCGRIPTPALALFGLARRIPTIMVTGSHIPEDRNGIKFHHPTGEILKDDEAAIRQQEVALVQRFDRGGMLDPAQRPSLVPVLDEPRRAYVDRFVSAFPPGFLQGKRVIVYEHSAVGRDIIAEVLSKLGADVVRLGRSETFVPVDTEAIRKEDVALAAGWAREQRPFAMVSTDGDSDRPLVADEHGTWFRGDITGILTAALLEAKAVVTPISSNTAVEKCGRFAQVVRTRIGSPYVIEAMERTAAGGGCVVGYEANGGFLTATPTSLGHAPLSPLPTRDAVIVLLSVLSLAVKNQQAVSALAAGLPGRYTASDRLKDFATARSKALLDDLVKRDASSLSAVLAVGSGVGLGEVVSIDLTDGLRLTFRSGEIAHLRASGNAPELRCYAEADSEQRARAITSTVLALVERLC